MSSATFLSTYQFYLRYSPNDPIVREKLFLSIVGECSSEWVIGEFMKERSKEANEIIFSSECSLQFGHAN